MPDLAPGEPLRDGGQRMLQPDVGMWRCAGSPFWWGELPIPVLMALLFSFSLLPLGAQEISLLLVSRVSLVCDPLLSGEVAFRELPPSFVSRRENLLLGGTGVHTRISFLSYSPGRWQGGWHPHGRF